MRKWYCRPKNGLNAHILQKTDITVAKGDDFLIFPFSVGHTFGIAQIDDVFSGQLPLQLPEDGKTADS